MCLNRRNAFYSSAGVQVHSNTHFVGATSVAVVGDRVAAVSITSDGLLVRVTFPVDSTGTFDNLSIQAGALSCSCSCGSIGTLIIFWPLQVLPFGDALVRVGLEKAPLLAIVGDSVAVGGSSGVIVRVPLSAIGQASGAPAHSELKEGPGGIIQVILDYIPFLRSRGYSQRTVVAMASADVQGRGPVLCVLTANLQLAIWDLRLQESLLVHSLLAPGEDPGTAFEVTSARLAALPPSLQEAAKGVCTLAVAVKARGRPLQAVLLSLRKEEGLFAAGSQPAAALGVLSTGQLQGVAGDPQANVLALMLRQEACWTLLRTGHGPCRLVAAVDAGAAGEARLLEEELPSRGPHEVMDGAVSARLLGGSLHRLGEELAGAWMGRPGLPTTEAVRSVLRGLHSATEHTGQEELRRGLVRVFERRAVEPDGPAAAYRSLASAIATRFSEQHGALALVDCNALGRVGVVRGGLLLGLLREADPLEAPLHAPEAKVRLGAGEPGHLGASY